MTILSKEYFKITVVEKFNEHLRQRVSIEQREKLIWNEYNKKESSSGRFVIVKLFLILVSSNNSGSSVVESEDTCSPCQLYLKALSLTTFKLTARLDFSSQYSEAPIIWTNNEKGYLSQKYHKIH